MTQPPIRWIEARGFTMVELLIALAIFVVVAFAAGSLYVSARRGLDYSSAEVFLQRQGTLIEERLTTELKSATSVQVTKCREVNPATSPPMAANKSIVYSLYYPGRATPIEYWCIYEYQRAAFSPFTQLWRCPLASLSADTCAGGSANAENLLPPVPTSAGGPRVEITNSTFCPTGVSPCTGSGVTPAARAVAIRFDMNLHPPQDTSSILYGARSYGFSISYRN